jgi:BA14K-like protein
MINLKVLSTAAAITLLMPMLATSASFAQDRGSFGGGGGGGGGIRAGGGGGGAAPSFAGRGGGGASFSGAGRGMRAVGGAPSATFSRGAVASGPQFNRGAVARSQFSGGSDGGRYAGGWDGGYRYHRDAGGYWPGAVAGAVVGSALASNYYYGGTDYYGPGYYDDSYAYYGDDAPVAVEAAPGGDASYCAQRYRSYDPASGTYLGYSGQRYPCP